jgi:Flp pilus assembly protein TadD
MNMRKFSKAALLLGIALGGCSHATAMLTGQVQEPAPTTAAEAAVGSALTITQASEIGEAVRAAQLQRRNGDFDGATRTLSQLVLMAPDDPRVLGEYGKTLLDKGDIPDATQFLQRAAELMPSDWTLYSALGVAYTQSNNYQGARAAFTRALMLKPNDPTVLNNFAMALVQAGDLNGAEVVLNAASGDAATHPRIAQNLAMVRQLRASAPAGATAPPTALTGALPLAAAPQVPAPVAAAPAPSVATAPPAAVAAVPPAAPQRTPADVTGATVSAPAAVGRSELPVVMSTPIAPSGPARATPPAASAPAAAPRPAAPVQTVTIVPGRSTFVQIAAYNTQDKANELLGKLDNLGARVMSSTVNGQTMYRVRIGPLGSTNEATTTLARVKALGYADARFVTEAAAAPVAERPGAPSLRLSDNTGQ